jgi:hypothetical protein
MGRGARKRFINKPQRHKGTKISLYRRLCRGGAASFAFAYRQRRKTQVSPENLCVFVSLWFINKALPRTAAHPFNPPPDFHRSLTRIPYLSPSSRKKRDRTMDQEAQDALSRRVIGLAIEVHRNLGPGL